MVVFVLVVVGEGDEVWNVVVSEVWRSWFDATVVANMEFDFAKNDEHPLDVSLLFSSIFMLLSTVGDVRIAFAETELLVVELVLVFLISVSWGACLGVSMSLGVVVVVRAFDMEFSTLIWC